MKSFSEFMVEYFYYSMNSKRIFDAIAVVFIPIIFCILYSSREFFYSRSNGLVQYIYDDYVYHRNLDLNHRFTKEKRMSYYADTIAPAKFEGSYFSKAGFLHLTVRIF